MAKPWLPRVVWPLAMHSGSGLGYLQGLSKKAVDETIAKAFKVRNNEK